MNETTRKKFAGITTIAAAIALTLGLTAPDAQADTIELRVDAPLVVGTSNPFSTGYTGTLDVSFLSPASTSIMWTLLNGSFQGVHNNVTSPALDTMTLSLDYVAGVLQPGSSLSASLDNGDLFTADVFAGGAAITPQAGGQFLLTADLGNATFTDGNADNMYGSLDIAGFEAPALNDGELRLSAFNLDANNQSTTAELDLIVTTPEPASVALLAIGGLLMASRRRSR